jgi:hypothetical protein
MYLERSSVPDLGRHSISAEPGSAGAPPRAASATAASALLGCGAPGRPTALTGALLAQIQASEARAHGLQRQLAEQRAVGESLMRRLHDCSTQLALAKGEVRRLRSQHSCEVVTAPNEQEPRDSLPLVASGPSASLQGPAALHSGMLSRALSTAASSSALERQYSGWVASEAADQPGSAAQPLPCGGAEGLLSLRRTREVQDRAASDGGAVPTCAATPPVCVRGGALTLPGEPGACTPDGAEAGGAEAWFEGLELESKSCAAGSDVTRQHLMTSEPWQDLDCSPAEPSPGCAQEGPMATLHMKPVPLPRLATRRQLSGQDSWRAASSGEPSRAASRELSDAQVSCRRLLSTRAT